MDVNLHGSVCPITALCIYDNYILAGCGSFVQIFKEGTCNLEGSLIALPCRTIHGFQLGPVIDEKKTVCIWGEKCMRILHINILGSVGWSESQCIRLNTITDSSEFEDWIWDVIWLECDTGWTLGLALAHNIVLHCDWQTGSVLQRVTCQEKCILYCARFIGSCWSNLVLAAGTVFNQVVLWAPGSSISGEDDDGLPKPILHRLTGHKGVIFSISYHQGLKRICSASDDRSIIMYQLHFPESSADSDLDWEHMTFDPMLTVFGHSGRVWDVVLLSQLIVSVGEDAHCIVWSYSGQILHKLEGHKGHNIWSLAASQDESYVVTGGGDSSIRQWHLQDPGDIPLTQIKLSIPDSHKVCATDFVRCLALWDYETVVLVTNAGSVLCYSVLRNKWQTLIHDGGFSSYSRLAVSTDSTYLAVAGLSGHLRVICRDQGVFRIHETKIALHSDKICGLTWVSDDHVLTSGLNGQCVLTAVQYTASEVLALYVAAYLQLPVCKYRWVVSGCLLSFPSTSSLLSASGKMTYLVCGDRSGSIHCYKLTSAAFDAEKIFNPVQTFPKIHSSAGVTWVCSHSNTVFSTGRDGQYRRWGFSYGQLQLLNSSRVLRGFDWIDRLWFRLREQKHYILGFYSSKFLVWDERQGQKLLEVECGGGHRAWDWSISPRDDGHRFVFIKAGETIMVSGGQRSGQDIIKPPLHGMKLWDMKCIGTYTDDNGDIHHVMCTGSEDTTLSLGILHGILAISLADNNTPEGGLYWSGHQTLQAHLSSVRTLAVVRSAVSTGHVGDSSLNIQQANLHPQQTDVHNQHLHIDLRGLDTDPASCDCVSAVVFSGGGRAQIQAWRVTVSHSSHQNMTASSQSGIQCQDCMEGKITPHFSQGKTPSGLYLQDSKKNVPLKTSHLTDKSAKDSVEDPLKDCRSSSQVSQPEGTGQQVRISYVKLAGCFLGEARHKRSYKPWKTQRLKLDPETRVMCLAAVAAQQLDHRLSAHLHLLVAGGSDGVLRLFLFDESQHHFILLCQSHHHRGCILKVVLHLWGTPIHTPSCKTSISSVPHPFLFSAATDGRIAVWDLLPIVQWLLAREEQAQSKCCYGDAAKCSESPETSVDITGPLKDVVCGIQNCRGPASSDPGLIGDTDSDDDEDDKGDNDHSLTQVTIIQSCEARIQHLTPDEQTTLHYLLGATSPDLLATLSAGNSYVGKSQGRDGDCSNSNWSPVQVINPHQSGVNSLHIKTLADGSMLLASGGDDNALSLHKLTVALTTASPCLFSQNVLLRERTVPVLKFTLVANKLDAHVAQITGVWVLSEHHIVTASVDQRVNLWYLAEDSKLKLETCRFVNTADLSNMDVWQDGNTVFIGVCGEGVSLLSMCLPTPEGGTPQK